MFNQDALGEIKVTNPKAQVYGLVKFEDMEKLDINGQSAITFFNESDPKYKAYIILGVGKIDHKAVPEIVHGEKIYSVVEEQAHPLDGITEFYNQLSTNMKYPQQARKLGVEGRVFIEFMVDENGELSDFKVIRGIGAGCDEEAMRVIRLLPNWKPGMQDGVAVKSRFNVAVVFKLN